MTIEMKVAQKLIDTKKTLAVAESCSGGYLSHRLTNIPGSSRFLHCAIVSYSNESKTKLLKIPAAKITKHGAVSAEIALMMAKNVRKLHHSDIGIGITGIAGPSGGTKKKPVGLTFISIASSHEAICLKCEFGSDRTTNKRQATSQALNLLLEFI